VRARRAALAGLGVVALAGGIAALGLVDPPCGAHEGDARAQAAVVLSGDVDYLRVDAAVGLYRDGRVGALVLTGAGVGGDSAEALRRRASVPGVPAEAIVLEPTSRTTRENLERAGPLIRSRGWTRVALVTSASHMCRASRVAQRLAPDVDWVCVRVRDAGGFRRVYRARMQEWRKLAGYAARGWL
jgi:uncharacterized SAM-binding protein YcdF (DUF218 family)